MMSQDVTGASMRSTSLPHLVIIGLAGLAAQSALRGQGVFETPNKFYASASWQFVSIDTEARLVRRGALGASVGINFEDTFDIPVQKQAWAVDGSWRMAPRHLLDVGYMAINRIGDRTITRDISWGDYTFATNAKVRATFDTTFPYLGYRYGFYEGGDLEMSVGGGISYLHIGMGLSATGTVTNAVTGAVTTSAGKSGSFDLPVPLLAFQIDGRISKDWFMSGYLRPFFISTGDFRGGMNVLGITANWFPSQHYGIGLGVERTLIDIQRVRSGDYEARFRYNISGLKASALFRF